MNPAQQLQDIVCHDLDPDFVEAMCVAIGWAYSSLFEELAADPGLDDAYRAELFGRRRSERVTRALVSTAKRFGVPTEFVRLECNGQNKLFVRAGRVILMQEPINSLTERPKASDFKLALSDVNGLIRQLELDLGDRPSGGRDWSGYVLAVVLHGASGMDFARGTTMLGGLFLGVADASYTQWVLKLDLLKVAMFGRHGSFEDAMPAEAAEAPIQADEVIVTSKRAARRGTA